MTSRRRSYMTAFALLAPFLAGLIIFRILPLIGAVNTSFYEYNLLSDSKTFVGLRNYVRALRQDPSFIKSLGTTLLFVLMKVPFQLAFGLGLAMLLRQNLRGVPFFRSLVFIPTVTSMVVVSVVWNLMFDPGHGILNSILAMFGATPQRFLLDPSQALASVTWVTIWKDVGLTMVIFLAGLKSIPRMYYEAATIDGASSLQQFIWVTLPLLKNTVVYLLIVTTTSAFQVFTPIYVMTEGGPMSSTKVVVYSIFEAAFVYMDAGYASALSVILLFIILAVSLVQFRVMRTESM
ncbi:MAG: carbohydrate ABC transporter permease [Bacillota bacterium]